MTGFAPSSMDKRWIWTATIGMIIFLFIQVFPVTGQLFATDVQNVMTRSQAEAKALNWAEEKFGIPSDQLQKTTVTHLTNSDATGYFSKNDFFTDYDKQWSSGTPTDTYAVELHLREDIGRLLLFLNMETGSLVAWEHYGDKPAQSIESAGDKESGTQLAAKALQYASFWGVNPEEWKWDDQPVKYGTLKFVSTKGDIGEAKLWLKVDMPPGYSALHSSFPEWRGGSATYGVDLPSSFLDYIENQEKWSINLSMFGFFLPQIILFILAIVYTGTHGGHTSYRRGIFLSIAFFVLHAGLTFNRIPGLRAESWDAGASIGDNVNLIVNLVTFAAMALLTYFSAVGGDGLWKSMGRSLWPRWKEPGYGAAILKSVREGYFLAFILLGAQSLILLILEQTLGSFASSDATQSMYNMSIPLLLPLLAWCAGISEELQSRLFGIGVFRNWFVAGARKLLGREPSNKTAVVLTTIAIVPPGLIWALGHVGYAIFPVYTRIIELVLMSFLFGWFMLRFGIMTVIFAHVTLDAILMGMQMMFDGLPWDFAGGVFSLVMPGLVGIVIWWLHRAIRSRKETGRPYA
ncbi:CPBP family intramembrane glutamic endopeptidase [Cohnella herbarum]|uniref:CPBP family intramembrane metalloprotease n=1 Tax=Cohnella herbarum TaxID=2728023 RepID=A0A7Z2VJ03_9BACL|nr:CPBP family intramembrane glutamic endopeptidase [Cohnella herbarum]QJD84131.1 CPBP family intramembrane metalloprotease [Cohnella herbarum]